MSTVERVIQDKIFPYQKIQEALKTLKDKKTVLVGGGFDILHHGHTTFLKKARAAADALIVALEPDEFIQIKKSKKPIHTQKQRAQVLASLFFVDLVIVLPFFKSDDEYQELVERIMPTIIAVTGGDPYIEAKQRHAQKVRAQVLTVTKRIPNFSSSNIKKL